MAKQQLTTVGTITLALCAIATPALGQVSSVEEIEYPPLNEFTPLKPERVELDNGMIVLLLEDHELPIVDVMARIRIGDRLETPGKAGVTSILAETLRTGGTETMSGSELDEYLDSKAATIEVGIGTASGNLNASFLSEDAGELLPVIADVLRRPVFEQDKIDVAKTQVNASIARQNDDPQGILFREFPELVYGDDSAYSINTTYDSVAAISREDLIAWHQAYLAPDRIILGVVGDFDHDEMLRLIEESFGDWEPGATEIPEVEVGTSADPGVYYVPKEDMTQSNIAIGHLGVTRDNPDYYAIQVFNEVFSGGFTSRLFANVRSKKGLAYAVRGTIGSNWDYPGQFRMWMTTKTETTGAGIEALLEEVDRLASDPITDEEIELAKSSILNSFVFNFDSTPEIMDQQLTYEYFGYPSDYLEKYRQGIEAVTREQVQAAAETYIHPEEFIYLVIGPSEGRDKPLTEYGEVAERDISIPELTVARAEASAETLAAGRALLDRALEAAGGREAVLGVESVYVKASGELTVQEAGSFPISMESWTILPDQLSQKLTLPFGVQQVIVTEDRAVAVTPMGVQDLGEEGREGSVRDLRRNTLAVLGEVARGELEGNATGSLDVDGETLQLVEVDLDGDLVELGINEAGQVVRSRYRGEFQGAPGEIVETYSDFREVAGLNLAHAMTQMFEGQPFMNGTVEVLEVNPEIPEDAFVVPEPDESEETAASDG